MLIGAYLEEVEPHDAGQALVWYRQRDQQHRQRACDSGVRLLHCQFVSQMGEKGAASAVAVGPLEPNALRMGDPQMRCIWERSRPGDRNTTADWGEHTSDRADNRVLTVTA